DADGRADIYSLGCVAYFLLTGQPVFSADSAVAMGLAQVKEQPAPPSTRSEFQIPPALDAVILECLAKAPAARPATAADLARRSAGSVPPDAWTGDPARAWWEWHRVALAAAAPQVEDDAARPEAVPEESVCQRCWPQLDKRNVPQQPASPPPA